MSIQEHHATLMGKIAAYTEILFKDPNSTIFVSLAETYRKLGMHEDGRQILTRGLERHPDFCSAHIVFARILCQLEDYVGSTASFSRALELDPDNLAALVGFARVKILLGEEGPARQLLLRARELSPADPVINKLLLSLPEEVAPSIPVELEEQPLEDLESAEIQDDLAEESEQSSEGLASITIAELYEAQGLKSEALTIYRQLLIQSPDDLILRRKIKELEAADVVTAPDSPPQVEVNENSDIQETIDPGIVTAEDLSCEPVENDQHSENMRVVEQLNVWLANIQRRREHV